nr:MgtC/SapB family protein [Paenibacillus sp. SGZ-1014]
MLVWITIEHIFRVIIAGLCGAMIGYERRSRHKEAGIRTHFIVSVGAALMMVISKYGFIDMSNWENVSLDPSRIAAQIVSGVGFLGAGTIFMSKQRIKGLTTAAGIWATAGVGMAVGAGMYAVGIGVAALILIVQFAMHGHSSPVMSARMHKLTVHLVNHTDPVENLLEVLDENSVQVLSIQSRTEQATQSYDHIHSAELYSEIVIVLDIKFPAAMKIADVLLIVQAQPDVRRVHLE